jgi:putative radical SAM enzyme (TIGR03279 family)
MTRETYGMPRAASGVGAVVSEISKGSDAERSGIVVGDRVLAVDGELLHDILDWQWLTEEPEFVLTLERAGDKVQIEVERVAGRPLGVSFTDVLFDGVRECDNACAFCFVSQLPAGLRRSLYVRDDDFRLSFLNGTFITLTNLEDPDVDRIILQRLSPLYVSLHAIDNAVRRRLICPTVEDRALERVDELLAGGIGLHVQIVLVPGVNDGTVLDETLEWLAARDGVLSVGVVPLGYTGHQSRFSASFEKPEDARRVVEQIRGWQVRLSRDDKDTWLQAADEFYLNAGIDVPDADAYGQFPHYENGVGLVRTFLDELVEGTEDTTVCGHAVAVTGTLFAPTLRRALESVGLGHAVEVLDIENELLGGGVSVTGLLGGSEIARALRQHEGDGPYLVPDVVVNSDGLLLDDTPAESLPALAGGKDVRIVPTGAMGIVDAVCE